MTLKASASQPVSDDLVEQSLRIVREAGGIVVENLHKPKDVRYKGRIDPVTETDIMVEAFLKERLSALLPDCGFLAEESDSQDELRDDVWIIDPLDGTVNFAHGLPITAISAALWRGGGPALGIVAIPPLGEVFHAVRGGGAFLNAEAISVSSTATMERALAATGFPYSIREHMDETLSNVRKALFHCQGLRRMGAAAVDLAYTAAGRLDVYFESMLKPWDVAAGVLLVAEAGGRVGQYDMSEHTVFSPTILATNAELFEQASDMLAGS